MQITVNGQIFSREATAGEIAGLGIARARAMAGLALGEGQPADTSPDKRPGYIADDFEYLEGIIRRHFESSGEDPQTVMERCLRSWSTDEPPLAPAPGPLSEGAQRALLIVYATTKRDSVIAGGITFGGKRYQTRPDDRENVAGASQWAFMAVVAGAQPGDLRWHGGDGDFVWIAEDNSLNPMDAQTVIEFAKALAAHKSACIFICRGVKDAIAAGQVTTTAEIDAVFS